MIDLQKVLNKRNPICHTIQYKLIHMLRFSKKWNFFRITKIFVSVGPQNILILVISL